MNELKPVVVFETPCPKCGTMMQLELDPECDVDSAKRLARMTWCASCRPAPRERNKSPHAAQQAPEKHPETHSQTSWAELSNPNEK